MRLPTLRIVGRWIKRQLPTSLFGRSLLIIILPVAVMQVAVTWIFFDAHWETVTSRLSEGLAGEVAWAVESYQDDHSPQALQKLTSRAEESLSLSIALQPGRTLPVNRRYSLFAPIDRSLQRALSERLDAPYWFDTTRYPAYVDIRVQVDEGVLRVLGALAAGAGPLSAQTAPSWRIATEYPATAMPGEGIAAFAAAATRLAAGALAVRPAFDAPDGLRSAGMLAALAAGRIEAADAFTGAMGGEDPIFLLSSLPFLTASAEDARRLFDAARPEYEAALARRGAVLLYATPWPPSGLWTRRPVTGPADMAGLRVRCFDRTSVTVLRAAGAAAEELSFADTMPRLP